MDELSNSENLGDFSRWFAENFLEKRQGRSGSKIIADFFADLICLITGRRPSRDTVEDWVHVGMIAGVAYVAARR